ncbi:Hypothetical protein NTJ_06230 [Nesidiocoris tenuis]|uniref:Uncharacterized protein n=1 Tax=Nesidiocoris tenuis TaxID=355587 RepID=A0ABN7AR74_9HEMI|nr:Hypothetical protein NTJ_06230 [Nesidiocoris tenuis]
MFYPPLLFHPSSPTPTGHPVLSGVTKLAARSNDRRRPRFRPPEGIKQRAPASTAFRTMAVLRAIALFALVKCCAAVLPDYGEGDYGDVAGDYGDGIDDGFFLEESNRGASGYKDGDSYNKRDKGRYGYESHSEYGDGEGDDGQNGSYESSYTYGHEEKPKHVAYSYQSSSGSPHPSDTEDYGDDGDYLPTKLAPRRTANAVEQPSRTYRALYNTPGVYDRFDPKGAFSAPGLVGHQGEHQVYEDAERALQDVKAMAKMAGPQYLNLFPRGALRR